MRLPRIGTTLTERTAVAEVDATTCRSRPVGGLGFVFREQPTPDAGVDGHIEILDLESGEFTGRFLGVQVKGGDSYFSRPVEGGWALYIKKPTVEYWRNYAVPVILTLVDTDDGRIYWLLVSEGEFEEKKTSFRIVVPESQPFDATAADEMARLALRAPAALAKKLDALVEELSQTFAGELTSYRNAWREGRRTEARAWVRVVTEASERLKAIDPPVAARVLRWAAGTILDEDGDLDEVRRLVEEARQLDPLADDFRLRAAVVARTEGTKAALDLLGDPASAASQITKAAILLHIGDREAAAAGLTACRPDTDFDVADLHSLGARLRLSGDDLPGALEELASAKSSRPKDALVRLLEAQLDYVRGLAVPVRPGDIPPWPTPVPSQVRAADPESLGHLAHAAEGFHLLLQLDWSHAERRRIQAWRLASLCLASTSESTARAFAEGVLVEDPAHPLVLLWTVTEFPSIDVSRHIVALEEELERTNDVATGTVYLALQTALDRTNGLGIWLDEWRERFSRAGALEDWAFWRARVYVIEEDPDEARRLLADIDLERARVVRAGILATEANRSGHSSPFIAHLEASYRETGDPQWILDACEHHAAHGRWGEVLPHLDLLLHELPTPFVHRLAVFARYHTEDVRGCLELLDGLLEGPDKGVDEIEYRRIRAAVRRLAGDVPGAINDLETVVARHAGSPLTSDLLALVQARAFAGQIHELAATARQLRRRTDLEASEALILGRMLASDDPTLAQEFWHFADAKGILDDHVVLAIELGYRLGLDQVLERLRQRMVGLARAGHPSVRSYTTDEVLAWFQDRGQEQNRVLELYRRGETATHMVAEFLGEPLAHFYHFLPETHETGPSLRYRFPLQLRSGSRALPASGAEVAAPGQLAMDLSALLVAAHLEVLDAVEEQFAPVRLPSLVIPALQEQREKLKPHQPSRIEIAKEILRAERRGSIETWQGDLPLLTAEERVSAGGWSQWLALLERALVEGTLVLDVPLTEDAEHGRPNVLAGAARLDRIVTVADVREVLGAFGALAVPDSAEDQAALPRSDVKEPPPEEDGATDEALPELPEQHRSPRPSPGDVIYMTDGGSQALAAAGLLSDASDIFKLRVDPTDQDGRRALVDAVPDLEEQAEWIEILVRRISDGLSDGRYVLLPPMESYVESADKEDVEAKGDRPYSLQLRCLADLVTQPADALDAVWIEDRWLGRHRLAGATRITDGLEVLSSLEAAHRITETEHRRCLLRLRAANVRIIPLEANEILYHLRVAPISNGRVVETRPLRILRQYAAATLEDAKSLQVPDLQQLSRGEVGELEVLRAYDAAWRESLLNIWRSLGHGASTSALARAEAESAWIMENLYIDAALMRSRAGPSNLGADQGLSALTAAGLLVSAIQVMPSDSWLRGENEGDIAGAYTHWIYDAALARRVEGDERFRRALVEQLRRILIDWAKHDDEDDVASRAAAHLLANRIFELLPGALQDALAEDAEFIAAIGRAVVSSLSIGRWHVEVSTFASAAADLLAETPSDADVTAVEIEVLPGLDEEASPRFQLSRAGPSGFTLWSDDVGETMHLSDLAFGVLAPNGPARQAALEALRDQVDLSVQEWRDVIDRLEGVAEPGDRLEEVMAYRDRSLRRRYSEMIERWKASGKIAAMDLSGNDPVALRHYLRVDLSNLDGESDFQLSHGSWDKPAAVLLAEEGCEEAFSRLSGLPVRLPQRLLDALEALEPDQRERFVKGLLRRSISPLGAVHTVRALSWLGRVEPKYLRLAVRLIHRWSDPSFHSDVQVMALVAREATTNTVGSAEDHGAYRQMAIRLVGGWLHADHFLRAVGRSGGVSRELLPWLEGRKGQDTGRLFEPPTDSDQDLADPALVTPARFAVAALQYVTDGTPLLAEGEALVNVMSGWFTHSVEGGNTPHIDLIQEIGTARDRLGTWVQPKRETDGRVLVGGTELVPLGWAPSPLIAQALEGLEKDAFSSEPWITLALVRQGGVLGAGELARFHAATDQLDLPALLTALSKFALPLIGTLARNAQLPQDVPRRATLRQAFLAMAEAAADGGPTAPEGTGPHDRGEEERLTDVQGAILEGCYLLAQAEESPAKAMAVFADDLRNLSNTEIVYLKRVRTVVEELVLERPLAEAEQLVSLLLEARGA